MQSSFTFLLLLAGVVLAVAFVQKSEDAAEENDAFGEPAARHHHCTGIACEYDGIIGTFYSSCPNNTVKIGHDHSYHCDCCAEIEEE